MQNSWTRPCVSGATRSFLNRLAAADRARIEPYLEATSVLRGSILTPACDAGEYLYFPDGPLISLEQGNRVEVGLVGSEGLVGWPALVGCERSPYLAVVRGRDGTVFRVRTEDLLPILQAHLSIGLALNRFVSSMNVQMAETIGAYASHRVDVRLARWILLRHDRVGGDEILGQHDEIAENLGARRASITDTLHIIEGDGLVRCRRGRIVVRDRSGLEELAAGCYGAAEAFYRETIGSFGKPASRLTSSPARVSDSTFA
jgi:CRP-like cAMP-binding protein